MLESLLSLASYRSSDRRNPSFLIAVLFHALVAATLWAFSFRLVALVEQELVYPWYYPTIPVELTRYESPPPAAPAKALNDPAKPSAPEPAPQVPEVAPGQPLPESSIETSIASNPDSLGSPDGPIDEPGPAGGGPNGGGGGGLAGGSEAGGPGGGNEVDPCQLGPCRIDSTITPPVALAQPDPEYPRVMIHARLEGTVELEIVIGIRGEVESVEIVSGNEPFASAAVQAVKRWRYRAAERAGVPIRIVHRVVVRFRLR
jgi:TonB family protein